MTILPSLQCSITVGWEHHDVDVDDGGDDDDAGDDDGDDGEDYCIGERGNREA